MKILMLNYEYPPLGGGQGNANKYVFEEFNRNYNDIQIDIITSSVDKEKIEEYKIGKIYYLDIGKKGENIQHQGIKNLIVNSYATFFRAKKLFKTKKYDLIVAWSGLPSGYIARALNFTFKIPYIVLLRGTDVPFHEKKWYWLDKIMFQWTTPLIWKRATKVIANSSVLKQLANKTAPKINIDIITNGIDIDFFKPEAQNKIRDKKIILAVGRLAKIKGYDILLNAVVNLTTDYEVWFVGKGAEEENLRQLSIQLGINEQVIFHGYKDKNELKNIYQQATVFCLTSYNEGMSNAMLEAMACGLPVISTNVGGAEELIHDNGIVINKGNASELTEAINKIIADKIKLDKLSVASRKIAESKSWNAIAKQFYNQFLN